MSPAGRPEIGHPINIRLGDGLLAAVDAKAKRLGESRAEVIRMIVADALANWQSERNPCHQPDDALRLVRKFPDKCCAEVSRSGVSQPCDKPAVAVAHGDTDGWRCGSDSWWPVCPHHSRGRRMVPLADLLAAVTN